MRVIPAIDIRRGQCVRLYQGREDQETTYWKDPLEMASTWKSRGAKMLHVADLDGAFQGHPVNLEMVVNMKKTTGLPVQVGGGYRDFASIKAAMEAGIDRVILGTAAVYDPDLVTSAIQAFKGGIAVSIDVSDDYVAVAGWKEVSAVRFDDLAKRMHDAGVEHLLFTDTRKDGTLSGPNVAGIKLFLKAANGPVIVSGGIATLDDVSTLRGLEGSGLAGIVIGKALYDKQISLEDAMRVAGDA